MVRNLLQRFFEIWKKDGLASALYSTQRFLSNKADISTLWRHVKLWKLRLLSGDDKWSIIRDINGSKMELDIRPSGPNKLERTLALEQVREPGATNVFQDVLNRLKSRYDKTIHVFDIGANVGYFALLEARILGEQGHIYAIEAEPNNVARLKNNIELNEYTNIEVLQIGLGAEWTQLELAKRSKSNIHRMKDILGDKQAVDTVDVEVRPLDALIAEKEISRDEPIIVRMDIEGYEGHAFEGMSELVSSDRPVYIFAEIHPYVDNVNPNQIADTLTKNGFYPNYISLDGGETYEQMNSIDEIREIESNSHIMLERL